MPPPQGTPNPLEGPGDYTVTKQVHSDTYPAIDPTKLATPLTGRAVFIVGASRGIGKAIAIAFARGGASYIALGARADLTAVAEEVKAAAAAVGRRGVPPPVVLPVKIEVSDTQSVQAAASAVEEAFGGRCDIIVQSAAIFGAFAPIADADPDKWWHVFEVNAKGQFLLAKYFLPLILKSSTAGTGGSPDGLKTFVTLSSVGAHIVGPGVSQYQTTKLLNLRLAEFIDAEYSEQGVSAFCVHPGNVLTDMVDGLGSGIMETLGPVFVDTPEISADSIVYLTAEKRQWLSGRYINCTWDMPELLAQEKEIVSGDKLKVRLVI